LGSQVENEEPPDHRMTKMIAFGLGIRQQMVENLNYILNNMCFQVVGDVSNKEAPATSFQVCLP